MRKNHVWVIGWAFESKHRGKRLLGRFPFSYHTTDRAPTVYFSQKWTLPLAIDSHRTLSRLQGIPLHIPEHRSSEYFNLSLVVWSSLNFMPWNHYVYLLNQIVEAKCMVFKKYQKYCGITVADFLVWFLSILKKVDPFGYFGFWWNWSQDSSRHS